MTKIEDIIEDNPVWCYYYLLTDMIVNEAKQEWKELTDRF